MAGELNQELTTIAQQALSTKTTGDATALYWSEMTAPGHFVFKMPIATEDKALTLKDEQAITQALVTNALRRNDNYIRVTGVYVNVVDGQMWIELEFDASFVAFV